jgi:hypothetical protein
MPSSVVRRYAYRPHCGALDVEFVSGRVYRYCGVPADIAEEMRAWRSKGAFLNRKVRGRFDYERLPGWTDESAAAEPAPSPVLEEADPATRGLAMTEQDKRTGRQPQSQDQSQAPEPRRSDGPFVDRTRRAGAGLHPGSDRDDYGAPESESGRVGGRRYDEEGEVDPAAD